MSELCIMLSLRADSLALLQKHNKNYAANEKNIRYAKYGSKFRARLWNVDIRGVVIKFLNRGCLLRFRDKDHFENCRQISLRKLDIISVIKLYDVALSKSGVRSKP